ncbi:CDP-glycerol glycerophosphotransferase family protein [Arthrobacter sulfonylureivorans]|uniref:bifunctional glycosyltransferase/CDP-glycerol:glycerophosphate glycerophosphotransferase n=1 Tax=Arthrobacter sulfonylureivorans TaxID=2486855 RepID=UPI0039E47205
MTATSLDLSASASDEPKTTANTPDRDNHGGFSLVVAMYNIGRYLDDFFRSLEQQNYGFEKLDVVLVNDGSTDDTGSIADAWAERHSNVTVLHKENGGQASARNLGLSAVRHEWVCFVDPDDMLDADYFAESHKFMVSKDHREAVLYATNPIFFEETTGEVRDGHPLRGRFTGGNRVVDLRGYPNSIQMQATTAFFRVSVLREHEIYFGEQIRPKFEDAHFVSNYLLRSELPLIGIVSSSKYLYRRRSDGTSTLQTSHGNPGSYTDVPRYGLLDILRRANELKGTVPQWLQNVVLYDVFWYLKSDQAIFSASAGLPDEVFDEYHSLLTEILGYIDEESVMAFDAMPIALWMRQALIWGYDSAPFVTDYAIVRPLDPLQNLVKLTYRYTGELPEEEIFVKGRRVQPRHAKIQHLNFLRRTVLKERTLWISAEGTAKLRLNGRLVRFVQNEPNRPDSTLHVSKLSAMREAMIRATPVRYRKRESTRKRYFLRWAKAQTNRTTRALTKENLLDVWTAWLLRSPAVKAKYGSAWVLMDRDNEANDSAEELYHWLRANRPKINAWYVLRRDAPDWDRLQKAGVKLVEYGSFQWKLLMLSADHYASSHIDNYVVKPLPQKYGSRQWRFTFLQHGIIKGDLSRWLNPKSVDLFITSTRDEYNSIAGDGSPYRFSSKEVRLTGLPRHDALLRKRQAVERPNLILIAPTWRSYLVGQTLTGSAAREHNDGFTESDYVRNYKALLHSPKLRAVAEEYDLTIAFMPHPNTQPYMDAFEVPEYVEIKRYGADDVQQVMAETAVMVTDYSSIAFNIAYLDSAVVYFQFDRDEYFGGGHTERPGYFSYEENGFGPVVENVESAVEATSYIAARGGPEQLYQDRIKATFPVRDGSNSLRVFNAMRDSAKPLSFKKAIKPFDSGLDKWLAPVSPSRPMPVEGTK